MFQLYNSWPGMCPAGSPKSFEGQFWWSLLMVYFSQVSYQIFVLKFLNYVQFPESWLEAARNHTVLGRAECILKFESCL